MLSAPRLTRLARVLTRRPARVLSVAAAATLLAPAIASAVTVTPTALYINSRTRSGTLTLINTDNVTEEVELTFTFGYPQLDPSGKVIVPLSDIVADSEPSAMAWLHAFPRRVRLAPGQRQVIRITVEPPAGLGVGEYWARVEVHSRAAQGPVETRTSDSVRVQISLETNFTTALSYRNGAVTTGLAVTERGAVRADTGVRLDLDLQRTGNAAYLGHLHAELLDPGGGKVGETDEDLAVYRKIPRHFFIAAPKLPASLRGYHVRYTITTDRPDLPADGPLPAKEVTGSVAVTP